MDRPDEAVRPDLGPGLRLIDQIGTGGMGTVWTAHHAALDRIVAVKVMSEGAGESVRARARFTREAKTASLVKGPHVVEVLEVGTSKEGIPFIVMELLRGRDFSAYLEEHGRLPVGDVVRVISQLASALSSAHALGVVHRDVKPSNVFVCEGQEGHDAQDGLFVKLLDFGIAKDVSTIRGETTTGVIGTPHYMSPEQLVGGETDFRSDLWALGVVAFRALTGARPFERETLGALALAIHTAPLPHPSSFNASLPLEVDEWFFRACARDPKRRFDSAEGAASALETAVAATVRPRPTAARSVTAGGFVRSRAFDRTLTVAERFPTQPGGPGAGRRPRSSRILVAGAALAATCLALAGAFTRVRTGASPAQITAITLAARADHAPLPEPGAASPSEIPAARVALAETHASRASEAQRFEPARDAHDDATTAPVASARATPRRRAPASPSPAAAPAGAQKAVHASARIVDDLPDDRH